MNLARTNVIPLRQPKPRAVPVFSADPRHAGLTFPRTASAAFKDASYAGSLYVFTRAPWYVRLAREVREILG